MTRLQDRLNRGAILKRRSREMNKDEIKDMAIIISGSTELDTMNYYSARYKAKALIDAGYRRVGEDEIVIKKREYDTLLRSYTLTYDNAYQWGLKVGEEKTAIEILQELFDYFKKDADTLWIKVVELAEEHGIELE